MGFLGFPRLTTFVVVGVVFLSHLLKSSTSLQIALTRENPKKNAMLRSRLETIGLSDIVEIPCLQHSTLPFDANIFSPQEPWSWILCTSPFSAKILTAHDIPSSARIASVGGGTSRVLRGRFEVAFEPSVANGKALAEELPAGEGDRVLYPTSAKGERAQFSAPYTDASPPPSNPDP